MIQPDICAPPRELSNGALEDEIATLAAHIAAAEYRFLCLVAELDRRQVWAAHGLRSAALLVGVALWRRPAEQRGADAALRAVAAAPPLISPMVALELDFLREIGRVREPASTVLTALEAELGLITDHTSFDRVVSAAASLSWTRDPFDRLIAAQAQAAGARLLTRDRSILDHASWAFWPDVGRDA